MSHGRSSCLATCRSVSSPRPSKPHLFVSFLNRPCILASLVVPPCLSLLFVFLPSVACLLAFLVLTSLMTETSWMPHPCLSLCPTLACPLAPHPFVSLRHSLFLPHCLPSFLPELPLDCLVAIFYCVLALPFVSILALLFFSVARLSVSLLSPTSLSLCSALLGLLCSYTA